METIIDDYKKKKINYNILSAHSKENLLFDITIVSLIEFCMKEPISILY